MSISISKNAMHEKIASVIYTIDPEGVTRFLLRHNKPFGRYEDEWTLCFGNVEEDESIPEAAVRESKEEYGISDFDSVIDLKYSVEYTTNRITHTIHFFALQVSDISVAITLNEESIGYDWMTYEQACKVMQHSDESHALSLVT